MEDIDINVDLKLKDNVLTAVIKDKKHKIVFSIDNLSEADDTFHNYLDTATRLVKEFTPKK